MDEKSKALEGATIQLVSLSDTNARRSVLSDAAGSFHLQSIIYGYYRLRISYVGMQSTTIDSIHFRAERQEFNINDIILKPAASSSMEEIIIYAEKPLVQSKDGNITFNAGESPLSAGSNVNDLLNNVPLVAKDPNGKLTVRGKEPRILIDDKPVELNQQQLQDLLESMPGSAIEKIEVMTNPPPQYASEQGGVINIVTRKGTVGFNGRVNVYGGTRGETGLNAGVNYRRQGLAVGLNAGVGYSNFDGNGYSRRTNLDSLRFDNTNRNENRGLRPNARLNVNYDLNKFHALNLVMQYNQSNNDNRNITEYQNRNKLDSITYFSERTIASKGYSYNPNLTLTYTMKTARPGEVLRFIGNAYVSDNSNDRRFYELYFNDDRTPTGLDTTQQQINDNVSKGYNFRFSYDRPLANRKTFLSVGSFYQLSQSDVEARASSIRKGDSLWMPLDALTNHFLFRQYITNLRGSVRQVLGEQFSVTAGLSAEQTRISFDLYKTGTDTANSYWSYLPFLNINKNWKDKINLTLSYRRSVRRPGIGELNPTVDFSDRYSNRFGNPGLKPSLSHNFDLVLGKSKTGYYLNLGLGYNIVEDIFNQVRTLVPGGKTDITWQNISGRKEYEVSTWNGYTFNKNTRLNLSASYTYNRYDEFEKKIRKFRDGGSLTSNLNMNYIFREIYNATGSVTFNRFANPQGTVRSSVSMNLGLQARLMKKRFTVTLNIIDPFMQQENRSFTYGLNFTQENYSLTQTRNFRLSLAYSFSKSTNKKKGPGVSRDQLKKILPKSSPKAGG